MKQTNKQIEKIIKDWIDEFGFRPEDETVDFIYRKFQQAKQEGITLGYSKGLTEGYSKRGEDLPKSYEKAIEDIEKIIRKVREDFIDFNLSLFLTKIAELKKRKELNEN